MHIAMYTNHISIYVIISFIVIIIKNVNITQKITNEETVFFMHVIFVSFAIHI